MHILRIIFSSIVIVHALIHLIGSGKEWQIPGPGNFSLREIIVSASIKKITFEGFLWWICFAALVFTSTVHLLNKDWWWLVALGAILLSQTLIILSWNDAKWGTVVNVIILASILVSFHQWKFDRMVKGEVHDLLISSPEQNIGVVTLESTNGLPAIVQKWLKRANVIGKERANTVHLKQEGRMRAKPGSKWMAFKAEQYFTSPTPGFVWKASIDAGNFITIAGRDKYTNGHGNMLIKAMSMITIADSQGEKIDQGTMIRYLAEISWFPSAALNDYIT